MAEETLFDLPNAPEEFGVVLPPSNLRKIDFSGLDFATSRKAILEYIKTYYPEDFNDFVASNGIMMLTEIVAAVTAKMSLRADMLAGESTLPTAQTEEAVVNHLALINQKIRRQTPSVVDVEITIDQPTFTDIEIQPGTTFSINGPDNSPIVYEIYRAPEDWDSKIIIPANKRGVIAYGIEGAFAGPVSFTSAGGPNQTYVIQDNFILESPIVCTVVVGNSTEEWVVTSEPIERYSPTDKVVEVIFVDAVAKFRFGDDVTGQAPLSGAVITFKYRVGGGIRGKIGVGQIDSTLQIKPLPPATAAIPVRFRNVVPSSGGTDRESLEAAKRRAPRDYALQRSIVTSGDYAQAANSFSHPVYGTIVKSIATVRTSKNANMVEIYALAEGPDGLPVVPSVGLESGLATYFDNLNVMTDSVVVLDGAMKSVDIEMNVIVNRNADASVVKERVETAITNYFDLSNWEMGAPFYVSNFIGAIKRIDGVAYIDLYSPTNNILPTGKLADPNDKTGVGFNELVVEGTRKISYYYEKNPAKRAN